MRRGRRSGDQPGVMERREMEHRAVEVFKQAVELIKGGTDVQRGIDLLSEAIKLRPRVPRYYFLRGNAQRSLGRHQRAFFDYGAAIRLDDSEPNYFSARGLCHRKLRRYKEALDDFAVAIELDPSEPTFYFNRGLVEFELGDFSGSRRDFTTCLNSEGRSSSMRLTYRALFNRAQALRRLGHLSSAASDLVRATEMDPGTPSAFEALATVLVEMGDYEGAKEAVGRALENVVLHPGLLTRRALCAYHLGQFASALTDVEAAIQADERARSSMEWTTSTAVDDLLLGQTDRSSGPDPDALLLRAAIVLASGDARGAMRDASETVHALVNPARLAAGLEPLSVDGDRNDVKWLLKEASASTPGEIALKFRRSEPQSSSSFKHQGRDDEIAAHLRGEDPAAHSSETGPSDGHLSITAPPTLPFGPASTAEDVALLGDRERIQLARAEHTCGLACQAAGEYTRARGRFARAVRAWPQLQGPRYHLALMLFAEGHRDEAADQLSLALEEANEAIKAAEEAETAEAEDTDATTMGSLDNPKAKKHHHHHQSVGFKKQDSVTASASSFPSSTPSDDAKAGPAASAAAASSSSSSSPSKTSEQDVQRQKLDRIALRRKTERQARRRRLRCARGLVYQALGQQKLAVEDFTAALELSPGQGPILYHRAVTWLQMDPPRLRHAVLDLLAAAKGGFDGGETWDKIATAQILRGPDRLPAAIEAYSEAIQRDPLRRFYRCRRAQCYREVGDAASAEEDLTVALGHDSKPSYTTTTTTTTTTTQKTSSTDAPTPSTPSASTEPIVSLTSVPIGGTRDPVGNALGAPERIFGAAKPGDVASKGPTDSALGTVREPLPPSERSRLLFLRGLCRYDQDKFELAIQDYLAALDSSPPTDILVRLHFALGIAYSNSDRHTEAVQCFTSSLEAIPPPTAEERLQSTHERAKSLQMLHRHQEAIQDFTNVLNDNPSNAHALFRRAFSFKALRQYEKAASDFEDAKAADPSNPNLAVNYRALHDVDVIVLCAAGEEPLFGTLEVGEGQEGEEMIEGRKEQEELDVGGELRDLGSVGHDLGTSARKMAAVVEADGTGRPRSARKHIHPPASVHFEGGPDPTRGGTTSVRDLGKPTHYGVPVPEGFAFHSKAALRGQERDI